MYNTILRVTVTGGSNRDVNIYIYKKLHILSCYISRQLWHEVIAEVRKYLSLWDNYSETIHKV